MNSTPVKTRRKFDETFKREAVQNWLNSGKSAEVIAQELGLRANRLYAWKKCFAPADAGGRAAAGFVWRGGAPPRRGGGGGGGGAPPPARPPICKANWTPPGASWLACVSS